MARLCLTHSRGFELRCGRPKNRPRCFQPVEKPHGPEWSQSRDHSQRQPIERFFMRNDTCRHVEYVLNQTGSSQQAIAAGGWLPRGYAGREASTGSASSTRSERSRYLRSVLSSTSLLIGLAI